MQLIRQIQARLHNYLLKKETPSYQIARCSVSLEEAKSIGILFEATQPEAREAVLRFAKELKEQGKSVKLLAFFDNTLKSENFTFHYFNRKQLDLALRPGSQDVDHFKEQPFDLLLTLSNKSVLPLDYIAAHAKARFRVGPCTDKIFCYDLMIESSGKKDLPVFLKEVISYLTNIRANYEAAIV